MKIALYEANCGKQIVDLTSMEDRFITVSGIAVCLVPLHDDPDHFLHVIHPKNEINAKHCQPGEIQVIRTFDTVFGVQGPMKRWNICFRDFGGSVGRIERWALDEEDAKKEVHRVYPEFEIQWIEEKPQ